MNSVQRFSEEEQRAVERQLGAGVGAGRQLLVSGFFSELEQVPELQSPGGRAQAQQAEPDPEPAPVPGGHLLLHHGSTDTGGDIKKNNIKTPGRR